MPYTPYINVYVVPHIFVWGSGFWLYIPSRLTPAVAPPPPSTLCHAPSFFIRAQLCHTPLCHTPSFTHNFVRHHLTPSFFIHTFLSHTIFHTQLCHTPSFTHNFVTHHLSCTTLSHTTLHGRRGSWRHPPSFCVAGVALATFTFVLRGRRGRCGHVKHPRSNLFLWVGSAPGVMDHIYIYIYKYIYIHIHIYIHTHTYIYMYESFKGPCKAFNCQGRQGSTIRPRESFFWRVGRCEGPCFSVFFGVFFHIFVFFCHLLHTFSVIFIEFIGFVNWYYLGIQLDSWCQLVLHVYIKM